MKILLIGDMTKRVIDLFLLHFPLNLYKYDLYDSRLIPREVEK